jgi:hypothetical protein
MALLTVAPYRFQILLPAPPSEFVGPSLPLEFKIWEILVNYPQWSIWMEGVRAAKLIDSEGSPARGLGRGSKFSLYGPAKVRTLEILHWAPGRKLIYAIGPPRRKTAYSYEIEFDAHRRQASIVLMGEVEVFGLRRLVSRLIAQRYRHLFIRQGERLGKLLNQSA